MAYRESTKDCTELAVARHMRCIERKHEIRYVELQNCEDA